MEEIVYRERRGTDSVKWDVLGEKYGDPGLLAMWVADMDFQAPQCVREALKKYAEEGVFGYYRVPDSYYEAFIDWENRYHHYAVKREWIRFAPGVVPAINWLVQLLTAPGDGIGVMTPVYYPFMDAVKNNGRKLVDCPMRNQDGVYTMDLEHFEQLAQEGQMKLFILCSPHNPVGRVWSREELTQLLTICRENHIYVLADEIHQDIVTGAREQTAAATVGDTGRGLVTLTAPSKTFNLAGLQNSIIVIEDEELRSRWDELTERLRMGNGNAMGYIAAASAYAGGREWLEQVLTIIRGNFEYLKNTLKKELPKIRISELEGTYLAWVDLGAYVKPEQMEQTVQRQAGLAVDYGDWFGGEAYATCIRINLATCRENVERAARQLTEVVKAL